jgi:hypothetical protein
MSAAPEHIRVLTSCTGLKAPTGPVAAEDLYRGQHHVRLMRGASDARRLGLAVEISIVSAGHGIVAGSERLLPYERTFQGMPTRQRRELARGLAIPRDVRAVLSAPADLHVVLLGEDYLDACEFGEDLVPSAPVLIFCASGSAMRLPPVEQLVPITLTTEDTRRFNCGLVGLKGEVGGRLLSYLAEQRPSIDDLTSGLLLDDLASMRDRELVSTAPLF